jgi:DNA-binding MurR/RpiR family transcriptional regulator
MLTPKDLLIAVSLTSRMPTRRCMRWRRPPRAARRLLSISDSLVSPIAKPASVTLQVRESEIRAFRSLSASMCLAQALVIGFAFEASRKEDARAKRRKG